MYLKTSCLLVLTAVLVCQGCRASITAVPLSPWNAHEPQGIPYYLPKPLLVVAKNVRHINEAKVGLTESAPIPNGFDNQAAYADVKANVTVPGDGNSLAATNTGAANMTSAFDSNRSSIPSAALSESLTPSGRMDDGIAPDSFYTYQIIFVPDLSQKYGLRIKGGTGEIRAAMNFVNGWMYTGMGPYYMKDSSMAQNLMAGGVGSMYAGRGVANVLEEVNNLARAPGGDSGTPNRAPADPQDMVDRYSALAKLLQSQTRVPQEMINYAEIYIYEPSLSPDGAMCWNLIAHHNFDRHYFQPSMDEKALELFNSIISQPTNPPVPAPTPAPAPAPAPAPGTGDATHSGGATPEIGPADNSTITEFNLSNQNPNTTLALPPASTEGADVNLNDAANVNLNDLERRLLALPPVPSAYSDGTQTNIDVNVDLSKNRGMSRPRFRLPFLRTKPTPNYERRFLGYRLGSLSTEPQDSNTSPGESVKSP